MEICGVDCAHTGRTLRPASRTWQAKTETLFIGLFLVVARLNVHLDLGDIAAAIIIEIVIDK